MNKRAISFFVCTLLVLSFAQNVFAAKKISSMALVDKKKKIYSIKYSNNDVYVGEVKGKMKNGEGRLTSENGTRTYVGTFKNDKKNGFGIEYDSLYKKYYKGQWVDDEPSGLTEKWPLDIEMVSFIKGGYGGYFNGKNMVSLFILSNKENDIYLQTDEERITKKSSSNIVTVFRKDGELRLETESSDKLLTVIKLDKTKVFFSEVVKTMRDSDGSTTFILKNGQVWMEQGKDYRRRLVSDNKVVVYFDGKEYRMMYDGSTTPLIVVPMNNGAKKYF